MLFVFLVTFIILYLLTGKFWKSLYTAILSAILCPVIGLIFVAGVVILLYFIVF